MRLIGLVAVAIFTLGCGAEGSTRVAPRRPESSVDPSAAVEGAEGSTVAAARPLPAGAYDLGQLPVLSKVLFYVRENYFDKSRFDYRNMALNALDYVQRDVPEVVVEHGSGPEVDKVKVSIGGAQAVFSLQQVDTAWGLRSTLQRIFQFVQSNLSPVAPEEEGQRLLETELAAVNGMLYTLDPHSVLLDPATYAGMYRRSGDDRPASVGLTLEVDPTGRIVVVDAQTGAPAARAGIAPGDRIVRIDADATEHMDLGEVIERLRGPVDSTVELAVERTGRRNAEKQILVREPVNATSIFPPPRLLPDKIGYLRLRRLGGGASAEVDEALRSFVRQGASGVVMDLRGNPGGLYAEASKVADEFVDQGTIVSMITMGGSKRKDETATGTAPTPQLPLVVLIDHETASGGEIIAAAMKNLDRGVVIGEPTRGLGTVQVLFDIQSPLAKGPDIPGGKLGLKLTTAQILAAGGSPLQGSGVIPDIVVTPFTVAAQSSSPAVHPQSSRSRLGERGFERSSPLAARPRPELPVTSLRYFQDRSFGRDDDAHGPPNPETDPVTVLARGLLRNTTGFERHQLLATATQFLANWSAEQDRRLTETLDRRGIDWTAGPPSPAPSLELTLQRLAPPPGTYRPLVHIRGVVKNVGKTPAFRVHAVVQSDHPAFDEAELVFGRIAPGQSKSYDLLLGEPLNAAAHAETTLLHATLIAQDRALRKTAELLVEVAGAPRSTLSFRYQVREAATGSNRNGRIERGERIEIPVTVTNTGPDALRRVRTRLVSARSGDGIAIPAGRFDLGELGAGSSKTATFAAFVPRTFGPDHCDLKMAIEPDSGDLTEHPIRVELLGPASTATGRAASPVSVEVDAPRLTVRGPAVAASDSVRIEGTASSDHGVHDVYVKVWNANLKVPIRKVFYQLNKPADSPQMAFETNVPVTRGANFIQVFARHSTDDTSMETVVVFRPAPSAPDRADDQR